MSMRSIVRPLTAALLGVAVALLASCGGSGKGLIPEASAGPLRGDFEAVAQAAESGNGNCAHTEAALGKTEKDFLALPASVDPRLRDKLQQGIANLRQRALAMCVESAPTATTVTTETTPTETAPTETTPTETTPTTPVTPPNEGGGTQAPSEEEGEEHGPGKGKGKGKGLGKGDEEEESGEAESGGASAGGASVGSNR